MAGNREQPRIFYGWWIVVATFVIATFIGGVLFYGFTAFITPIRDEMGWSNASVSFAVSLRGVEAGMLAPVAGMLVDRLGPRRLVFGGALVVSLSLVLLSYTTSLALFYLGYTIMAFGMSCCTLTVPMTAIANWFRNRLGLASGIAIAGFGFSGVLIPFIVRLIDTYTWRTSLLIMAAAVAIVVLPLSLLFRHRPERYGYLPDGASGTVPLSTEPSSVASHIAENEVYLKPKQVLRTGIFWKISLAYLCHMILTTSIVTHVMPYLESMGISRYSASLVATFIPILSIAGRTGFGLLADRYEKRLVSSAAFIMMGCAVLVFIYISSSSLWLAIPFVILFGIGYGGNNTLRPTLVRQYFGRANFGVIFGMIMGINSLGGIIGPTGAGWIVDHLGSYQVAWYIAIGIAVFGLSAMQAAYMDKSVKNSASRYGQSDIHHS